MISDDDEDGSVGFDEEEFDSVAIASPIECANITISDIAGLPANITDVDRGFMDWHVTIIKSLR